MYLFYLELTIEACLALGKLNDGLEKANDELDKIRGCPR